MSTTSAPSGAGIAVKQYSKALSAMAVRQPTPLKSLTGPMPTEDQAMRKLRQQSTIEMPVVRVDAMHLSFFEHRNGQDHPRHLTVGGGRQLGLFGANLPLSQLNRPRSRLVCSDVQVVR